MPSGTRSPLAKRTLPRAQDETAEPALAFIVRLGTSESRLVEGAQQVVEGSFFNPRVSVSVEPERTFTHADLSFSYPRHFTFEADLSPDADSWTMTGNDVTLMIFRFPQDSETSIADFARTLAANYGAEATVSPAAITLGGVEYQGKSVCATLAGYGLKQDVFDLPPSDGRARFILVQGPLENETTETTTARDLLTRTFRLDG